MDQRACLITGAAAGVGAGVARRLARDSWRCQLVDIRESVHETASRIAEESGLGVDSIFATVADVSDADAVERSVAESVARFGGLDVAVANAGVGSDFADVVDISVEEFDRIVRVNLRGTFLTCRAAGRVMRSTGHGSIVTISSVMWERAVPGEAAYNATKAGIVAFTQSLALEMAPYGIRVNCIAPGAMATEMHWEDARRRAARDQVPYEQVLASDLDEIPLRRFGTGDDIGGVIAFLASDDASYITGQVIDVNGGLMTRF